MLDRFYASPVTTVFCQKYNINSVGEIHPSLTNRDRIGYYIQDQVADAFPDGCHIKGVIRYISCLVV